MAKSFVFLSHSSRAAIPLPVKDQHRKQVWAEGLHLFFVAFVQKGWVKGSNLLRSAEVKYGRKKEFGKGYQSLSGEALSKKRPLQIMKARE